MEHATGHRLPAPLQRHCRLDTVVPRHNRPDLARPAPGAERTSPLWSLDESACNGATGLIKIEDSQVPQWLHRLCLVGKLPPPMDAGPGTAASPTRSPNNPAQDTVNVIRHTPQSKAPQEVVSLCRNLCDLWTANDNGWSLFTVDLS